MDLAPQEEQGGQEGQEVEHVLVVEDCLAELSVEDGQDAVLVRVGQQEGQVDVLVLLVLEQGLLQVEELQTVPTVDQVFQPVLHGGHVLEEGHPALVQVQGHRHQVVVLHVGQVLHSVDHVVQAAVLPTVDLHQLQLAHRLPPDVVPAQETLLQVLQVVLLELLHRVLHPGQEGSSAVVDQQHTDSVVHQVFLGVVLLVDLLGAATHLVEVVLGQPGGGQEAGQVEHLLEFPLEGLVTSKGELEGGAGGVELRGVVEESVLGVAQGPHHRGVLALLVGVEVHVLGLLHRVRLQHEWLDVALHEHHNAGPVVGRRAGHLLGLGRQQSLDLGLQVSFYELP